MVVQTVELDCGSRVEIEANKSKISLCQGIFTIIRKSLAVEEKFYLNLTIKHFSDYL